MRRLLKLMARYARWPQLGNRRIPGLWESTPAIQQFEEIGRCRSLTRHVASGYRLNPVTIRLRIETKVKKIQ